MSCAGRRRSIVGGPSGHAMTERRGRSVRLAAARVVDFERPADMLFLCRHSLTSTPTFYRSRTIMLQ
jgi:hypothetical protein